MLIRMTKRCNQRSRTLLKLTITRKQSDAVDNNQSFACYFESPLISVNDRTAITPIIWMFSQSLKCVTISHVLFGCLEFWSCRQKVCVI